MDSTLIARLRVLAAQEIPSVTMGITTIFITHDQEEAFTLPTASW